MTAKTVAIFSPAKINLTLAITGLREDGFHNLVSVVSPIDFGDTLYVAENKEGRDCLTCTDSEVPLDESNLILKAAKLYREFFGSKENYDFHLEKRIPMGAGLGGGVAMQLQL